jgi:hypothetical protein
MGWFSRWFGYGLGAAAGKAIFDEGAPRRDDPGAPPRQDTEEQIRAAERRYDEEAKRFEAADATSAAEKKASRES